MFHVLMPWLPLATKLLLTVAIVVVASVTAERAGALVGGLVISLPVTMWPAYLFLSLDHDLAFVAASATAGLVMHAATAVLMLVYVLMAPRFRLLPSLAAAVAAWLLLGLGLKMFAWSFAGAALLNLVAYPLAMSLARSYRGAAMPKLQSKWYDIPARALFVCLLMSVILAVSSWAGPVATGFVAVFPISTLSAILILNARVGGKATGATIANGMHGAVGIALALAALHLTVVPCGPAIALTLMLVISIGWNLLAWAQRGRRAGARP